MNRCGRRADTVSKKFSEEQCNTAISMLGKYTLDEISEKTGMTRMQLRNMFYRRGVDVKKKLDEARKARPRIAETSPCTVCAKSSEDCMCIVWKNWFTHQWKEVCRRIWTAVGRCK